MDQIDDPFEQQQAFGRHAQPGANHNAVEARGLKRLRGYRLGGFAEIDEAAYDFKARIAKPFDLCVDVAAYQFRRKLRERAEIDKGWVNADCKYTLHVGPAVTPLPR